MFVLLFRAAQKVDRSPDGSGYTRHGLVLALAIFSGVVSSGASRTSFIPIGPLLFLGTLLIGLWVAFSRIGGALTGIFTLGQLVVFQSFRIPLELILHRWSESGTVPLTMTWTGQNVDIASGIAALLFAPFIRRRPSVAWIPTLVGLALLANVIRVVVLSSPLPFAWPLENPLQLIMHLPYALIVPLCVVPALIGHLVTIRKLCLVGPAGRR